MPAFKLVNVSRMSAEVRHWLGRQDPHPKAEACDGSRRVRLVPAQSMPAVGMLAGSMQQPYAAAGGICRHHRQAAP
eukprot:1912135-Rhodomonas_salina.1